MSNILSAALLLVAASDFFEENPTINEVYVTEDGQPFILENRADLHASENKLTYKKYQRSFDQEEITEGKTETAVDEVQTPKQPDVLDAKNPELRGADPMQADMAQQTASQKAAEIETDENYESVAAIVSKIPEMDLETLKDYLVKESAKDEPRKTLVKALTEAIAKLETPEESN